MSVCPAWINDLDNNLNKGKMNHHFQLGSSKCVVITRIKYYCVQLNLGSTDEIIVTYAGLLHGKSHTQFFLMVL